tara:strand:- start:512 stop:721 length:210 start_codon:yes stop_codon:yes gene_type:complete
MSIRKYKFNTRELLAQVNENELIIKEKEENPKDDNRGLQLDKQISQVKARIAALQQTLDSLEDRRKEAE